MIAIVRGRRLCEANTTGPIVVFCRECHGVLEVASLFCPEFHGVECGSAALSDVCEVSFENYIPICSTKVVPAKNIYYAYLGFLDYCTLNLIFCFRNSGILRQKLSEHSFTLFF